VAHIFNSISQKENMKSKVKEELISKFVYECGCGCGELQFTQWKDDGMAFITYVIPAWYAGGYTGFKNALKIIWNILRGRQYYFYEITIEDNYTLRRFKEFVANMQEIDESKI
jgi:hypothetical protein